jgi:hypothetical protein
LQISYARPDGPQTLERNHSVMAAVADAIMAPVPPT